MFWSDKLQIKLKYSYYVFAFVFIIHFLFSSPVFFRGKTVNYYICCVKKNEFSTNRTN